MSENLPKRLPKDHAYYVSNPELFQHYVDWHKAIITAKESGEEEPQVPRPIAEAIMKICHRLSFRANFINYSYKEEMVLDAIENCIRTAKNFNPEKSSNPFSFITTIAFNAFLRRIEKEKQQSYIKGHILSSLPIEEMLEMHDSDQEDIVQIQNSFRDYLRHNNYVIAESPKKKKVVVDDEEESLDRFMMEDTNEDDVDE